MGKFWDILSKIEQFVMIFGMTVMVALNFTNVVFRYALPQSPFSYSEELTIITFIWVSMFGISYGYRVHAHTAVDFFTNSLPKQTKPFIVVFLTICSAAFIGLMVYTSYFTMANQWKYHQVTPGMKLPMVVNSGALFLGAIITFFSVLRAGILEFKEAREELKGGAA